MAYEAIHILVVEDDDFQRSITVKLLRTLGVTMITEAHNGEEALACLNKADTQATDLIISDLKMPKMDGIAFLRQLGVSRNNVEIVILSSLNKKLLSAVHRISDIYKLNLLGTLQKPAGLKQLKNILDQCGNSKPSQQQTQHGTQLEFTLDEILDGIRHKQFSPYLQPKVDLKTGVVVGAEALARWIHPKHGLVPPYAFISKLEENKKIDDLTFLMLEECASIDALFQEKNQNFQISVNLSLVSLSDPEIAQRITSTVMKNGGNPRRFTLEITESTAMTDAPIALENLARLSMNNFTLSVDDYGTGYSNLQQLTRIDFEELKIDRSLVHGFTESEHMQIIVASNIDMAHKLKIKCVAEGIENEQDWKRLREMGCDIGQGYYIGMPMNFIDFYKFVDQNQAKPLKNTPKEIRHFISPQRKAQMAKNILVVDNDDAARNAILKILINLGYQKTIGVKTAQEAINCFETQRFDLVFTDLFLPEINGLDLIKQIRTNKTLAKPNTRVVVLSGVTKSKALGVAMALNVNDFIVKPFTPDVVEEKIDLMISHSSHTQNPLAYETISTDI